MDKKVEVRTPREETLKWSNSLCYPSIASHRASSTLLREAKRSHS